MIRTQRRAKSLSVLQRLGKKLHQLILCLPFNSVQVPGPRHLQETLRLGSSLEELKTIGDPDQPIRITVDEQ